MTDTAATLPRAKDPVEQAQPAKLARKGLERSVDISAFKYDSSAELFPTRSRNSRRRPITYKRFAKAAQALRFAMEELPPDLLNGAYLEVDEVRFDKEGIRQLYESARYPLKRRVAPRQ